MMSSSSQSAGGVQQSRWGDFRDKVRNVFRRKTVQTAKVIEHYAPPALSEPIQRKVRKGVIEEIKDGGIRGAFGLDQVDWGDKIGPIWRVWQVQPCLGEPHTSCDACTWCCATWYCCSVCAFAKLYAASLEQPCALVPHCVMAMFCPFCTLAFQRYNLRFLKDVNGNLLGDMLCSFGCCPCALLQHIRSVKIEDWDLREADCPMPIVPKVTFIV
jgi:hypothetical protein